MVVWCTQNLRRDGCSFMWHQPCQRCKASHSCRTTCERSESAQESGEQRYISDHPSINQSMPKSLDGQESTCKRHTIKFVSHPVLIVFLLGTFEIVLVGDLSNQIWRRRRRRRRWRRRQRGPTVKARWATGPPARPRVTLACRYASWRIATRAPRDRRDASAICVRAARRSSRTWV